MTASIESGDFMVVMERGGTTVRDEETAARARFLCHVAASPGAVEIATDPGRLYAVFGDRDAGILSSSLRAVLTASGRRYRINREALCEQLVIGAVAGRETVFEGIERLDGWGVFSTNGIKVSLFLADSAADEPPPSFRNAGACVDFQLEILRTHFREIAEFGPDRPVSIGLSGGYDSRLMLLLALDAGIPIRPFTFTSPHHRTESAIAGELARRAGLDLRQIPLRSMDELDDASLEANIDDAILYFDGRTNETMGTFGDVHTARTQRKCLGGSALNLNGLGGELYRNRERLPRYGFSFRDWLWQYVIGPKGRDAFLSGRARVTFEDRLASKYGEILGVGKLSRLDRRLARRWYRDIWLPDFAGPRLSAENRVGPTLMPFAHGRVSAAALAATPFIGPHGGFQAALIRRLDENIAAVPSSYGPGFGRRSLNRGLLDLAMAAVPLQARLVRHRMLGRLRGTGPSASGGLRERFGEPLRLLEMMKLPLNIDFLLQDQVSRDRTLYVAEFLHRRREHLDVRA